MAVDYNIVAEKIFRILKGRGYSVQLFDAEDGNEIVDGTLDQVIEDLRRIDLSVRAFASNNLFQKQSLDLIYKRLKEGDIKLQKVEEEGQEIYYIIEDRYEDDPVKDVKDEELENFEWCYVNFYGDEDEG